MDNYRKMDLASAQHEQNEVRIKQQRSKEKLKKVISTKFRTTFIGAISSVEEFFGFLWGHNLPEEELTGNQKKWREVWLECRTSILNNGNSQLRAIDNELKNCDVSYNYGVKIIFNKEDGHGY